MNAVYSSYLVNVRQITIRWLACVFATTLLGGCQWFQASDSTSGHWSLTPDHWPWQQEETDSPGQLAQQQHINELLVKGELAFRKDRLSVPANDNAVLYYREILRLKPDSKRARKGLDKVANRYRELARTAHGNGDDGQTYKYLHLAEEISGANDPDNIALHNELKNTPKGQNPRALTLNRSIQEKADKTLKSAESP